MNYALSSSISQQRIKVFLLQFSIKNLALLLLIIVDVVIKSSIDLKFHLATS